MVFLSGFLCPVHTPDGTPCGLLNHLASACKVCIVGIVIHQSPDILCVLCKVSMLHFNNLTELCVFIFFIKSEIHCPDIVHVLLSSFVSLTLHPHTVTHSLTPHPLTLSLSLSLPLPLPLSLSLPLPLPPSFSPLPLCPPGSDHSLSHGPPATPDGLSRDDSTRRSSRTHTW